MTVSLSVFTGTNAATEHPNQTAITLLSADSASTPPASAKVAPGTNSFERWMAVSIDTADAQTYSNFWVEMTGDLPDGVTIRVGVADAGSTPTSATSTVAKTTLSAGRRFIWDANSYSADGDRSRFLVIQESVAASADSGAIPQQVLSFGYVVG